MNMSRQYDNVDLYQLRWEADEIACIYGGVRSIFEAYLALRKDTFFKDFRCYALPGMIEIDLERFPMVKLPEHYSQSCCDPGHLGPTGPPGPSKE